jgi:hypothetical protein
MDYQRKFPPRHRKIESEEGCKIEIKKTKNGRKVLIGKNCTKEQIQIFKETGELNLNDSQGG